MTNMYAVVMQSSGLDPLSQWLVIGLSMVCLAAAVTLSGPPTKQTRVVSRIGVGLVVAVLMATVFAASSWALVMMECSWWGCWLDTIFW